MSSKLDSLFQSKAMQKLQAAGAWMQSNKTLSSISQGMMASIGLILAGAVFMIIATLLSLAGAIEQTGAVYQWLVAPYNMTIGLISVAIAFAVGYAYTKNLEMSGAMTNGIVTMILFLMVAAPFQSVQLVDGQTTMTVMNTTYVGSTGLFTAMIMPLITIRIIKFCQDKHVTLSMPDTVPQFLQDSFSSAIPLLINIVLWCGINTGIESVMGVNLPAAIMGILAAPLGALTSIPGAFVLIFVCQLLWAFGIHGGNITGIVIFPMMIQAIGHNAELVAQGMDPVFSPVFIWGATSVAGGAGNCISLALLCLRSKSEQLKAIGKVGIVPTLFNISEPMAFGVPIMYNPLMFIPFIINPLIVGLIMWAGYATGFFQCSYIMIMTVLPIFFASYLPTLSVTNLLIPIIGFVVSYIIYLPFVKMYDKQLVEQEAEAKRAEEAAAA